MSANLATIRRSDALEFRRTGRIPQKLRSIAIRRQSGRAWAVVELEAKPWQIAAALGVDVTNFRRRRSGESGGFATVCEEVFRLESKGISTYALTAHLRSVAMQTWLVNVATEDLVKRLDGLQEKETEIAARLDGTQIRYALDREVDLQAFRDKAAAQAAVSEEICAIIDELIARKQENGKP